MRSNEAEIVPLRGPSDETRSRARALFDTMAAVFEVPNAPLGDVYLDALLGRPEFWAFAAMVDGRVVGGITAHELPMTRNESRELFVYDLAVRQEHQRRGIGRRLVSALTAAAAKCGIAVVFVPVDREDDHALEFYRAIGGAASEVVHFTFGQDGR